MAKPKANAPQEELAILPSLGGDWVELSRTKQGGLFRKHILNKGILIHPTTGAKINVDDAFVSSLKRNFHNGICDIVQVPLADDKNAHSENPERNIGEVLDVQEENGKVYAVIDARRSDARENLGKTWLGASAMLSTNYIDTKTGERVGPTLLHVAVTNRPYVTGLEDYQEILAASHADDEIPVVMYSNDESENESEEVQETESSEESSADSLNDETLEASTLTEEKPMTRDELMAALLAEHGIDVPALQAAAAEADTNAALSNALADQLAETLSLSTANIDTATIVGAIAELAQEKTALSHRLGGLERAQAEYVVGSLVEKGFVTPAKKDVYVELRLTQPDVFEKLIPTEPIVPLTTMVGSERPDTETQAQYDVAAEVARLTAPKSA